MKIARLKNLEKIVENVLREDRLTRIDDCYLILKVIIKIYPFEAGKTFSEVMLGAKSKGVNMKDILKINIAIIGTALTFMSVILIMSICIAEFAIKYKQNENQDEQIKILEQSLNEQIQEKQVYMKMLEER